MVSQPNWVPAMDLVSRVIPPELRSIPDLWWCLRDQGKSRHRKFPTIKHSKARYDEENKREVYSACDCPASHFPQSMKPPAQRSESLTPRAAERVFPAWTAVQPHTHRNAITLGLGYCLSIATWNCRYSNT